MIAKNSRQYLIKNQALPLTVYGKVLPEMSETLGQLIQRRMKDLGIPSKAELARRLGISSAYAGDLANDTGKTKDGTYKPGSDLVPKLSKELKVSEIEILTAMGYASIDNTSESVDQMLNELPEESRDLAMKQVKAIIKTFVEVKNNIAEPKKNTGK